MSFSELFIACVLAVIVALSMSMSKDTELDDMASQIQTVVAAGAQYIRDNQSPLEARLESEKTVTVSVQTLQEKGYLPTDVSLDNAWHQHYQLNVTHNPKPPFQLIAFVLTSGEKITADEDKDIALRVSDGVIKGGFIRSDVVASPDGSWNIFLKDYGVNSQQGHLFVWVPASLLPGGEKLPDTCTERCLPHPILGSHYDVLSPN